MAILRSPLRPRAANQARTLSEIPPFWKRCAVLFPHGSVAGRFLHFHPFASQGDANSQLFSVFPELGIDTYGPLPVSFSTVEEGWMFEARMI